MGTKLFVGNLSYDIDSAALEKVFASHGAVETASVVTDRATGRSKGFGFVEMASPEAAQAAIAALNGHDLGGRALNVDVAKQREDRPRSSSGGGRGGRY
jgi:cold-inducible RNA-binding protein